MIHIIPGIHIIPKYAHPLPALTHANNHINCCRITFVNAVIMNVFHQRVRLLDENTFFLNFDFGNAIRKRLKRFTNDTKPSDTEREKAEGVTTKSKEEKPREEKEEESETVEEVRSEVAHTCRVGTPLRYNTKMKMLN